MFSVKNINQNYYSSELFSLILIVYNHFTNFLEFKIISLDREQEET